MIIDKQSARFQLCLARAAEQCALAPEYRPLVLPLFSMPRRQWPECCGAGCLPCAQTLRAVAESVCRSLQVDPGDLP